MPTLRDPRVLRCWCEVGVREELLASSLVIISMRFCWFLEVPTPHLPHFCMAEGTAEVEGRVSLREWKPASMVGALCTQMLIPFLQATTWMLGL